MIDIQSSGGVTRLTLNRPDKANALTAEMLQDLAEAVESCREKALILTGTGKVFSAGADLDAARAGLATSPLWERLSGAIAAHPGLCIAALNGTVAGGACGMVLACDLRLATPSAKLFYPVMKLGFLPQPSDPVRLAALAGPSVAKLILMGGRKLTAKEALSKGVFDQLVAPQNLLDEAHALCEDSLGATPDHVAAIKAMIGG